MEDLSLLGNAAAVPVIVAITQFLKKNFRFKRKADAISLLVSFGVCVGWEFYYTPTTDLIVLWGNGNLIDGGKHIIHLTLVSIATWLSASKSYDLFIGEKKRSKEMVDHIEEKESLKKEVENLKNGRSKKEPPTEETLEVDEKIRSLLEGR